MNIIDLATYSRQFFFFFINKCNDLYRSGHDLILYREIIAMHREINELGSLLDNEGFCRKLYRTLEEWDMNKRGARMVEFDDFNKSLIFWKESLIRLYKYKLHHDIASEFHIINGMLEKIFSNIKVMDSKRKIVGVSKTLHFLLPDLIMPIDSKYTMTAFYGYNKYSSSAKKEFETFKDIFEKTYAITHRLELNEDDVDNELWKTSIPKLIDNSIIGLWNCESDEVRSLIKTEPDNQSTHSNA